MIDPVDMIDAADKEMMMNEISDPTNEENKPGFHSFSSLFLFGSILPFFFILSFSGMGVGLEVAALSQDYTVGPLVEVWLILCYILIMHIFDAQYWPLPVQICSWVAIFAGSGVTLCLVVALVPYGPLCTFTVLVPLSIFGIKNSFYPDVPGNILVGWNHKVYIYMAMIILTAFFYWCTLNGNMWDSPTNAEYSHRAGCEIDFTNMEDCENEDAEGVPCFYDEDFTTVTFSEDCSARCIGVYQACEEAFIVWSFPGLAAMSLFVMGFISKYLENPKDPDANHHISAVAKFCGVFLFLFWLYASLAGAGEGLSSSIIAFGISMFIGSAIVFSVVFWNSTVSMIKKTGDKDIIGGVAKQVESYKSAVRGLVVLAFSPLIIGYLFTSILNQFVRRHITRKCFRSRIPDDEFKHEGLFTYAAALQVEDFFTWDHAEVLSYAVYWGVGYVFLSVLASKFTTVFLSWLIEYTSNMSLGIVTIIVVGVGMILFMLPPIPGLPIYLTGGIVLVSVGRESLGLWVSILYACIVSLLLKLLACTVQQKLIGENLGGNIGVKQMVGINSDAIRAMRVMLSDPGITKRKVSVLVGGPDWPVSVLCGILGLDLFPILIGTLPVVALIIPTVLCGSFGYMGSLDSDDGEDLYPWAETMGAVASAVAAGAMMYFSLSAATCVKICLDKNKKEIEAIPIDEAVKNADAIAEKKKETYRRVTIWNALPLRMKLVLVVAVICMMGCCYMLVIFNSQCFEEYDLMYTISENLAGNWTNVVLPLGRIALLLFSISYVLLYIFEKWATEKAADFAQSMDGSSMEALRDTIVTSYSGEIRA